MLKKLFHWILYLLLCFCIFTAVVETCSITLLVSVEEPAEEEKPEVTQEEFDKAKYYLGCRLLYLYFTEGADIADKITVDLGVRYEIYRYSGSKVAGNMETYRYSNGMGLHYSRSMAGRDYVDEMEDHYIKLYLNPNASFRSSDVDSAYQRIMKSSAAQSAEEQYPEDYLYLAGSLLLGGLLLVLLLKTTHGSWPEGSFLLKMLPPEVLLACLIPGSIRVWQCFIHDRLFAYLSEKTPLENSLFWLIGLVMTDTFFGVHFLSRFHEPDWYKRSILYRIFHGLWDLFFQLKLSFRVLLCGLFLTALELLGVIFLLPTGKRTLIFMALLCLEKLVTIPAAMYYAAYFRRFHQAAREISSGNLTYQLDTSHMPKRFRALSTDMNSIGDALSVAVAESVKSEHLKTELITNVSHDIKTPLTSIINFSDLIAREPSENKKITEYAEHLHRQSTRLKKLIEDLVEASKASTGNIEVHREPCDVQVLLGQCLGEYEDLLAEKSIELVVKKSSEPLWILADTKLLWRVFDNLMNNVYKYGMEHSRMYIQSESTDNTAQVSFKNISKYAMDIPAEELMERFVRGDLSRHTEGSGLGLSIAKSLMELQGGELSIAVEADLFRATLSFEQTKPAPDILPAGCWEDEI